MQHARERAGQSVRAFTSEERLGRDRADALHKSDAIAAQRLAQAALSSAATAAA
jgi:hypothetical protein